MGWVGRSFNLEKEKEGKCKGRIKIKTNYIRIKALQVTIYEPHNIQK